ncbi:MAG: hypothetical protein K0S09_2343 [Sphingobacteriaceae bacterium]|jgi:probable DNA metabolism protein|nr:hypothetical protein [Sphingobacteriaceae bacterium]
MVTLLYDKTWQGLLTAIFDIYDRKFSLASIDYTERFQPDVFAKHVEVITDDIKASRVMAGLQRKASAEAVKNIYAAFLSELPGIENTILAYARLILSSNQSIEHAYGHSAVLKVSQVARMVHREKHRMEAFIRFKLTSDNLFYAAIEPDFNVIPLILTHFRRRYADQRWLIYDLKRKYGIYYNLLTVEEITIDFNQNAGEATTNVFHEDEDLYQTLWKDYFKSVNIGARKNTRLHLRHVPKRYWKHLTEKLL